VCEAAQEDLPESLEMMGEVVERMNGLIHGVNELYHSMFDELMCENVDMASLLAREVQRRDEICQQRGVQIRIVKTAHIWADMLALSRMVGELLDNALRYAPQGSDICIAMEQHDSGDVLCIKDDGCGMSDYDLRHAFQPFFTTEEGRSGMGLALLKSLTQAHGGKVWCHSKPQEGAAFFVLLPFQV